jgi:type IV pilus assembly protein PilN
MILINLLPYREARRQERKRVFLVALGGCVVLGIGIVSLWLTVLQQMTSAQAGRNEFLKREIAALDRQIKDIATLRTEIGELKARQQAVEDLQSNRNLPVHLFRELVQHVPDGVYLSSIRQAADGVTLTGLAQSNERVSELLRNLGRPGDWLDNPELIEIRASASPGGQAAVPGTPRLFQFSVRVKVGRPADASKAQAAPGTGQAAAGRRT